MHFGTVDRRKARRPRRPSPLVVGRFAARRGNRLGGRDLRGRSRDRDGRPAGGRRGNPWSPPVRSATEPPEEGGGATPHRARALALVGGARTPAGVVVIVSDFRGTLDWLPALTELAGRHAVIALEITDPREGLPARCRRADPRRPPRPARCSVWTPATAACGAPSVRPPTADRTALAKAFARLGVRHLRLTTDGPWLPTMAQGLRPQPSADPSPRPPTRQDDPHELSSRPSSCWVLLLIPIAIGFYLWAQRPAHFATPSGSPTSRSWPTSRRAGPSWRRHLPPALYLGAIAAPPACPGSPRP